MKASLYFVILAGLVSGCGKKEHAPAPATTLPTATVRVQTVQRLERPATAEFVGTVRPKLSASISAKVTGTIQQMLVSPGETVDKGQLLVQIDAAEIRARLDQAKAVREQTQKEIQRFQTLLAQNAATQQEFDAVQARSQVAEANVTEATTMLAYTKVLAPFAGVITAKNADVGDLAAPGKALLQVEDPKTLRFEADLPEGLTSKINTGDKLKVILPDLDSTLEGTVKELSPLTDPVTRTFRVKLDLPKHDRLRTGQFGRLQVPTAQVAAIHVPSTAITLRGQLEIAFVVINNHAELRLVKTGKRLDHQVEVLSGLDAGELIIVDDVSRLRDGHPLEVRQ